MDTLHIVQANLDDPQHQAAVLAMLRSYAKDAMGSSRDLAQAVQDVLIDRLRQLKAVEDKARELDCCKLTLEVQENNRPALALYHSFGFQEGLYEAEAGRLLFRQKPLL